MRVKGIFVWYDFWVGFFYDRKSKMLYFFPIPMFGIKIDCRSKAEIKLNCIDFWTLGQ